MKKNLPQKEQKFRLAERHWRIYTLVFFILIFAGVIFWRLYSLQVKAYSKYSSLAQSQHLMREKIMPERGVIFLTEEKEPYPAAINQRFDMAYVVPNEVTDAGNAARTLSQILGLDEAEAESKVNKKNDMFEILKRRLSQEESEKIRSAKIQGVYLLPESYRYYPGGELAAQVIGFVGSDGQNYIGRYGIEAYWEDELRGREGYLRQERDTRGRWISISDRTVEPVRNGSDIILTINHTVQYEVEKILRKAVEKHQADSGVVIAQEVKTGKILAMAGFPSFDPNNYNNVSDISLFNNQAISTAYECGSVFKPITAAIAINEGKVSPDSEYVDTGSVKEAGYVIKNSEEKVYGRQTMTQVLENSINTGAIFMQKQVGNEKFLRYLEAFGFGRKLGIELTNEATGSLKNLRETRRNINFYTASFGQGITVTPLQLVNAYTAIGNQGHLMQPYIVDKIIRSDGSSEEKKPQDLGQVISESTAQQLRKMLLSVVLNGHGKKAAVEGYLVGGKTGTAQVAKVGAKGYEEGLTIGSFAGLAPIDEPEFAVVVKINNPKDVQWAESTAAPVFSQVMKVLLEYYGIKPTEE